MKKLLFALVAICCMTTLQAQKTTGDLSPLKDQTQINIKFDYTGVTYDGDSEEKYLKEEDNAKDAQWKKSWTSTFRTSIWEPRLTEDINNELVKKGVKCGSFPKATYTMVVKIKDIDPGTFAGPMSVPSKITGVATVYKTGTKDEIGAIEFKNVAGNPYFMTPKIEARVGEAFSNVGKVIGKRLSKIK